MAAPPRLRVGCLPISFAEAHQAVAAYTADSTSFAWPYYDHLDTGTGPTELGDADLLAPTLLNAAPRIAGFAGMQHEAVRTRLEQGLKDLSDLPALHEVDDADALAATGAVGDLFAVLDDPGVPFVQGTILSKVLHRKMPSLIPLYDGNVRRVYVSERSPLGARPRGGWPWAQFMGLLAGVMRDDLRRTPDLWRDLAAMVPDGSLTLLRTLDILAWSCVDKVGSTPAPEE